jgi:hypothetical protein
MKGEYNLFSQLLSCGESRNRNSELGAMSWKFRVIEQVNKMRQAVHGQNKERAGNLAMW